MLVEEPESDEADDICEGAGGGGVFGRGNCVVGVCTVVRVGICISVLGSGVRGEPGIGESAGAEVVPAAQELLLHAMGVVGAEDIPHSKCVDACIRATEPLRDSLKEKKETDQLTAVQLLHQLVGFFFLVGISKKNGSLPQPELSFT